MLIYFLLTNSKIRGAVGCKVQSCDIGAQSTTPEKNHKQPGGWSSLNMSTFSRSKEDLKMIFLIRTKCQIPFIYYKIGTYYDILELVV